MSNPRYLEYTSAAVPIIEHLKPQTISPTDEHFICSPNLQAGYIKLNKGVPLEDNFLEASSHIFYVLSGRGKTEIGTIRNTQKSPGKVIIWKKGDVLFFDWRNTPHSTANCGIDNRPFLKVTGTLNDDTYVTDARDNGTIKKIKI